ncbi:Major facilitator superfamily domain, general substrate transporter [Purpureocillium lavendulum]|uniref:Major facilitator superfamily domain, general substrate transporter n=1 Tax=Purpureocillium lavendulum TaxID=1247861 RepID=A0AB34FQL8_9HYPO|nr:Major facilitator superfamily domain, general substrate transporter [Purpureocillium lavendulum]
MSVDPEWPQIDSTSYPYIFEKNVTVNLSNGSFIRVNIYKPKTADANQKFPVLATHGPYGKDVPYRYFHPKSFSDLEPDHQTEHSAWEVPTPRHWTARGYAIVRADEAGSGQSPGYLDILSCASIDAFSELVEWIAEQPWSNGKVGTLGISYYAASQWQLAACKPKGLACIVPYEGFSDHYRDMCRHGGILSNGGLDVIWHRQVGSNQYGLPGRAARNWGDDTIEGSMSIEALAANRVTLIDAVRPYPFRDGERFSSVAFNLEDVEVPVLSVANFGGIQLHLRGNVQGFLHSGSNLKYLRFIVGRHDLPMYYPEEVAVQESFFDAFLKGEDRVGWSRKGEVPAVDLILRKGNVGFNDPKAEKQFLRRQENEWPLARTQYTDMYLGADGTLGWTKPTIDAPRKVQYEAFPEDKTQGLASFTTAPFESETEITGHIVAHLNVSLGRHRWQKTTPSDMDMFVAIRHISSTGEEVYYTGPAGEASPITKGYLRMSFRKTNPQHPRHREWLPHRDYMPGDAAAMVLNEIYPVDVEIWPTNVIVQKGDRLILEIGAVELLGAGIFQHDDPVDRPEAKFKGTNSIHFSKNYDNFITLPIIPNSN